MYNTLYQQNCDNLKIHAIIDGDGDFEASFGGKNNN